MNLENPLVSLEWSDYTTLPIGMQHVQAVVVGDKVYVGGGMTTDPKADTNIYVFDHTIESPRVTSIPTPGPTRWSTLATIHSRLVLAGGAKPHNATNELWALNDDGCTWDSQAFPTMPKSCWGASAVSTGDYLILAGGVELHATKPLDTVQIYNAKSKLWGLAESLPTSCYFMKNTLLEGNWYLGGGRWQFGEVVYAELDALIQSVAADQRRPSEREDLVWKKLPEPELSGRCSSICAHRDQLLTIGGTELSTGPTRKIRMYSTVEKSWKMVGKMPKAYDSACTIVLPNAKDILLIGGNDGFLPSYTDSVTKGCLKGLNSYVTLLWNVIGIKRFLSETYNGKVYTGSMHTYVYSTCIQSELLYMNSFPLVVRSLDEQISLGALEHIQIVGETKGTDIFHTLASTNMGIGIVADKGTTAKPVLEWMARNSGNQAPTWKVLLEVFRIIKMKEVADKIEEFIKAVPEHVSA